MVNHDSCRYKNNHVLKGFTLLIWYEGTKQMLLLVQKKSQKSKTLYDVKECQDELQMGTKLDFPEGRK